MELLLNKEALKAAFLKYLPLGTVVFFIGLVWNFPFEKAIGRFTDRIAKNSGYQVSSDSISLALPIGIKGENVRITQPNQNVDLKFDYLRVTLSPFSFFTYPFVRSFSISFSAYQDKMKWKGSIKQGKEDMGFSLRNSSWKMNHVLPLDKFNPLLIGSVLKLDGLADFSVEFNGKTQLFQLHDFSKASGEIQATTKQTNIEAPFVKQVRFDKITIDGKLDNGKLNFKTVSFAGPDLNGTIGGTVAFSNVPENSNIDLDFKFTASPKFRETLATILPMLESNLGIKMSPEGTLAFKLSGPAHFPSIHGY